MLVSGIQVSLIANMFIILLKYHHKWVEYVLLVKMLFKDG